MLNRAQAYPSEQQTRLTVWSLSLPGRLILGLCCPQPICRRVCSYCHVTCLALTLRPADTGCSLTIAGRRIVWPEFRAEQGKCCLAERPCALSCPSPSSAGIWCCRVAGGVVSDGRSVGHRKGPVPPCLELVCTAGWSAAS